MTEIRYDERGREQVPHWYGISITTNKEKVIRDRIKALSKTDTWKDQIFDVILPAVTETNEKGKKMEKLVYTQVGYVHMILNTDTWDALEMLRGVGFRAILPGGNAQPIPYHDMLPIFKMVGYELTFSFETGDQVRIVDANHPFWNQSGTIVEVDDASKEVLVSVELFGQATKLKIGMDQIEKAAARAEE